MVQTDLYTPQLTTVEKDREEKAANTELKLPNELACGICHELVRAAVMIPCCVVTGRWLGRISLISIVLVYTI